MMTRAVAASDYCQVSYCQLLLRIIKLIYWVNKVICEVIEIKGA